MRAIKILTKVKRIEVSIILDQIISFEQLGLISDPHINFQNFQNGQ